MSKNMTRRKFISRLLKSVLYFSVGFSFVKGAFSYRSKMLINSLSSMSLVPSKNEDIKSYALDDKIVFLIGKGQKYEMNATGSFIWEHCNGETPIKDIAKKLSEEFEVNRWEALRDVTFFIRGLNKIGWVYFS